MAQFIALKIDLDKMNEAHLFEGKKGTYLDCVMFENTNKTTGEPEPDEYGNSHVIIQSVSKEAKARGERGDIIGNAKIIEYQERSGGSRKPAPQQRSYGRTQDRSGGMDQTQRPRQSQREAPPARYGRAAQADQPPDDDSIPY